MVTVTIEGLLEANATLAQLPEAFKSVAADTIEVGAAMIEAEAHERAPVDEGDLRDSIGTNIRADRLQADVGAGDFKAKWNEFGTEDTRAQPFLFPAFQIGSRWIRKQIRDWANAAAGAVAVRGRSRTSKIKSLRRKPSQAGR